MLKVKKAILALAAIIAIVLSLDIFNTDAQTLKSGGNPSAKPAAEEAQDQSLPKKKSQITLTGLAPRPGVDYKTFQHSTHSLDCATCHDDEASRTSYDNDERVTKFPYHPACEQCHSIVFFSLKQEFCLICHDQPARTNWPAKPVFPDQKDDQFGIKFPHGIHMKLKSSDFGYVDFFSNPDAKELKIQEMATNSACNECHVKDGKEKKEENFSAPHHPECARCHGIDVKPLKKVAPAMHECLECHKPFMPIRKAVNFIVPSFRHDKDHEADTRDKTIKAASKDKFDCFFCHKQATQTKRLFDIEPPLMGNCTVCHNDGKTGTAHKLTPSEAINLRPDPVK